jgi:hypothetical protein
VTDTIIATWLAYALIGYGAIGLLFSLFFVLLGVQSIDPAARGAGIGFRLIVVPGCVLLWPLLLTRWIRVSAPPEESNPHRDLARAAEDRL